MKFIENIVDQSERSIWIIFDFKFNQNFFHKKTFQLLSLSPSPLLWKSLKTVYLNKNFEEEKEEKSSF